MDSKIENTGLFVFSGSGHSLYTAKELARILEIAPIYNLSKKADKCPEFLNFHRIGLVFPCHFGDLPLDLREFLKRHRFRKNAYIFAVANCINHSGVAYDTLRDYLRKQDRTLNAFFEVYPQGSSFFCKEIRPTEKDRFYFQMKKMKFILENWFAHHLIPFQNKRKKLLALWQRFLQFYLFRPMDSLRRNQNCKQCGLCIQICPRKNIYDDGWGKDCGLCLACYHWCPNQAVIWGEGVNLPQRITHKKVSIEEMLEFQSSHLGKRID